MLLEKSTAKRIPASAAARGVVSLSSVEARGLSGILYSSERGPLASRARR